MTVDFTINSLPTKEREIWARLLGYSQNSFVVGGAVRDILLGLEPNDFDFATSLRPDQIIEIFSDMQTDLVGESFGVVLVEGVEIATFRADKNTDSGHQNAEVEYVDTIEDDLSRRDFTINAMAITLRGEIIDPFGGQEDLENSIIKFVGNAGQRIWEDPNRILRAARFAARFDFTIDFSGFKSIGDNIHLISNIAPERIRIEIMKTLSSAQEVDQFFSILRLTGVLEIILPELVECYNHTGGRFHPETVWEHIIWAVNDISPRFPLVRLYALFHDIGKPRAFAENEDGSFVHHDSISARIARERLSLLKFSNEEINAVEGLVRCHMRQGFYC